MHLTYSFRIKDSSYCKSLNKYASAVNFVWNYLNSLNIKVYKDYKQGLNPKFLTAFDMNEQLSGASKELNLHSQTLQAISEQYFSSRRTFKKSYLSWRSYKRSLGWIPFKAGNVKLKDDAIIYQKKVYRFWKSRELPKDTVIKAGSFNQDSRGRWFINITFETKAPEKHVNTDNVVGIDLGLKDIMTLSTGKKVQNPYVIKNNEEKLAKAQRANKKKQVKNIHAKIKNSRKDYLHKETTKIAKQFSTIVVGNVKSQDIIDKSYKAVKQSTYDAAWYFIKNLLEYKAVKLGGKYIEISEAYSTQDCSVCGSRTGPKGEQGLNIREWSCNNCHAVHDRDINAAQNILKRYISSTDKVLPFRT